MRVENGSTPLLTGRIVIATHNAGKLKEMRDLLTPFGIDTVAAGELDLESPAETGHLFAENAAIKAHAAAKASGLPALADDSGLCIDALDGAPGLFSADWARKETDKPADFTAAMARIERELQTRKASNRRAHFVCALALAWPDGRDALFEGRVFGTLTAPRGTLGFGYDPIFQPDGMERTFGELSREEKHGIDWEKREGLSHRARAFVELASHCLVRKGDAVSSQDFERRDIPPPPACGGEGRGGGSNDADEALSKKPARGLFRP